MIQRQLNSNTANATPCQRQEAASDCVCPKKIYLEDIQPLNAALGFAVPQTITNDQSPLMVGEYCHFTLQKGLTMHTSHVVEEQTTHTSIELPPGISFNFVFDGCIDFCFSGQQYTIGSDPGNDNAVSCSVIINNSREMLTRHTKCGMRIHKLNLFVERDWLMQRCQSESDRATMDNLFRDQQVFTWLPDNNTQVKAGSLVRLPTSNNFLTQLTVEHLAIELLSDCLQGSLKHLQVTQSPRTTTKRTFEDTSLIKKLEQYLDTDYSLRDIASKLGFSSSSLQRKFKDRYGVTAFSYLKLRRLELAKQLLISDKLSVNEVAYRTGYRHASNFINAFRTAVGMTPANYVKSHNQISSNKPISSDPDNKSKSP
ncbi:AraC family transcriptional regulator [Aestuariirhabdus sp. Z084]|uniref:helix-turn-helix domain-containing protein n=1 Tax=Aestuariirhabdus haliotis TaxID=2918751 RepID=UPI00201B439E|nr:AraC family transcriptional regulator [Aestuariirhabdus haliotis]MCL6417607.1 AraC family transcriptional regulator [Aestuariirhabdus haliotis]MCL6421533.1 AraC family transcriptional regulator [Aestuariirhabdus haliotis]